MMGQMNSVEWYETDRRLRLAQAEEQYHVDVFGDHLAEKYNYNHHSGIEAVWYFLIEKHHWTPAVVRALNTEDLMFLLTEEMVGWIIPTEAKVER